MEEPKIFERFFVAAFIAGLFLVGVSLYSGPEETKYPVSVYYLDVGQGDAEMIQIDADKEFLIDAGPDSKINSALGQNLSLFDNEIEAVLISHMHADHISGLNYLLERRKVGRIYLMDGDYGSPDAELLMQKIQKYNIPTEKIVTNQEIDFYGLKINFLVPSEIQDKENINNSSIAVRANYGSCDYLFLGDLTSKSQEKMMASFSKTDVLKISHHGSKDGTSDELISKTSPKFSVIEVGANNKFGHPAPSTISKLIGSTILRTDQSGTIKFGCDGQKTLLLR